MYKNIFNRVGVNIHTLYDSNVIYYLYLKSLNLDKKNIIFIDIGYRSTKVLMIKNEKISLIKTLPIGSYFITNDLVKILNVSYDFADKLKISHINLGLNEKKTIEIPVWEELGKNLKRKIDHEYLKSIIASRIDEIFNMILGMVPKSKFFYSYLVTGGGSMQINLKPYLKNKFGIEVEIFEPKQVKGIPTFWNNPSIMSLFAMNELIANNSLESLNLLKKNDSFSNKIWYKRFVDLL
jgi:cell division protein FtsA